VYLWKALSFFEPGDPGPEDWIAVLEAAQILEGHPGASVA
jgi:hypothetical protein